ASVGSGAVGWVGTRSTRLLLGLLVHGLGDSVEGRLQRLGLGVDRRGVVGLEHLADLLDRLLDATLGVRVHLVAQVGQLALGLVGRVLGVVARLCQLACATVVLGVGLGV